MVKFRYNIHYVVHDVYRIEGEEFTRVMQIICSGPGLIP